MAYRAAELQAPHNPSCRYTSASLLPQSPARSAIMSSMDAKAAHAIHTANTINAPSWTRNIPTCCLFPGPLP